MSKKVLYTLSGWHRYCLLLGVVLASLADAKVSTALNFARFGMIGDLYTSADEFAWLDIAYVTAKFLGFILCPWLGAWLTPLRCLRVACCWMALASLPLFFVYDLPLIVGLRFVQGLAGGVILVMGQSLLFQTFLAERQPVVQACFAVGGMVAPGMFVPSVQGLMVDYLSWHWAFYCTAILGVLAYSVLVCVPEKKSKNNRPPALDITGLLGFFVAVSCLTYIAQQASRWNWFSGFEMRFIALFCACACIFFITRTIGDHDKTGVINTDIFSYKNTCFGFIICLTVAGGVMFCSNTLIANLTVALLGFSPTAAGNVHIPAGILFVLSLFTVALLIQKCKAPVLASIPLGVILILYSLWLLSNVTNQSGSDTIMPALLVRGFGLGCLLLPLALFTLGDLKGSLIVQGVALFNIIRQAGGLASSALLQWYMDQQIATNTAILSAYLREGDPMLDERIQAIAGMLQMRGVETSESAKIALAMLKKTLDTEVAIISLGDCFLAVFAGILCCVPVLMASKILIGKYFALREAK